MSPLDYTTIEEIGRSALRVDRLRAATRRMRSWH
jgi:hypothetical protein